MSDRQLAEAERRHKAEETAESLAAVHRERRHAGLCFKCGVYESARLIHPKLLAEDVDDGRLCCCAECYESDSSAESLVAHQPCADCPHLGNLDVRPEPKRVTPLLSDPPPCRYAPDGQHRYLAIRVGKITEQGLAGGFCGPSGCPVCDLCNLVMCEHHELFDPRGCPPRNDCPHAPDPCGPDTWCPACGECCCMLECGCESYNAGGYQRGKCSIRIEQANGRDPQSSFYGTEPSALGSAGPTTRADAGEGPRPVDSRASEASGEAARNPWVV